MFSPFFRSYLTGFRVEPDDVPGFNIDNNGLPRRTNASFDEALPDSAAQPYPDAAQIQNSAGISFTLPGAEGWVLSAPLTGSPGFRVSPQDDVPGFNVKPQNDVPGFNLGEGGLEQQGTNWSDEPAPESVTPRDPDTGQMPTLPSGADGQAPPARPLPSEWPYQVGPVLPPWSPPAFDPLFGSRIEINSLPNIGSAPVPRRTPWNLWDAVTAPQAPAVSPIPSVTSVADPNRILAEAGDAGVQQTQQQVLPPQNIQTRQQIPASPPDTGRVDAPPALRVQEKPGTGMTPAEHQPEQELSQLIEECQRAAADLTQELARAATHFGSRLYEDTIQKIGRDVALLAERFAREPGETAESLLSSFPQTRLRAGGEFFASLAAVFTILANAVRGREFEVAVLKALNVEKNTTKIGVEGLGRSIPDILSNGITEIKSGVEIDSSLQLRVQAAWARLTRVLFNLIVGPATQRVSKKVEESVYKSGGTIQKFDPATGIFTPFQ